MDLTIVVISVWVLSTCFHEFGHAITAYFGGDKSVKDKGYLTLNPIVYFSSATTLVIPLLILLIGGIPFPGAAVSINTSRIKSRLWQSCVSLAGPFFTFLVLVFLAFLFEMLPGLRDTISSAHTYKLLKRAISVLIFLHAYMLMLNLIPIPPLDGFGVIEPWLPAAARRKAREFANAGFAVLILLFWLPTPLPWILSAGAYLLCWFLGIQYDTDVIAGLDSIKANALPLLGVILVAWIIRGRTAAPDEKADKLLREGKYAEALELYNQALSKREDPRLLTASATCLLSQGRKHEALARAEKAVALDPGSTQAQGVLAACLAEAGEPEKAIAAANAAIEADGSSLFAFPLLIKASVLNESGQYGEALESVEKYLQREPNAADGIFLKASCLENLTRYQEALALYDKAARMRGANIRATLAKGILMCALGKQEEGMSEFNKVLPSDPEQRPPELESLRSLLISAANKFDGHGKGDMAQRLRDASARVGP